MCSFSHRRMHWRGVWLRKQATTNHGHHIVSRQMRDQAWQRDTHFRLPNLAQRLGLHRIPVVTIMRQEINQMRWDISKHNFYAYKCIALVMALYVVVGLVERAA